MFFKIQSENARKTIALLSTIVSIGTIYGSAEFKLIDRLVFNHICLLQIIASVVLFIGTINANQWFFLPWLVVAFVFAYTLVYYSINMWFLVLANVTDAWIGIVLAYTVAGFWFYFIHAVYVDFQDMRIRAKKMII